MRAAGMEAVGMRRDAAHRVHRRPAGRASSRAAARPSRSTAPAARSPARRRRRRFRRRDAADRRRRDAAGRGDRLRRVLRIEIALGEQLEHRHARLRPSARRRRRRPCAARHPASSALASASPLVEHQRVCPRRRARTARPPPRPAPGSPARRRWCSARGNRDRPCRRAATRGPAPARTARRCRGGCRSIRRRSRNSRCAPD